MTYNIKGFFRFYDKKYHKYIVKHNPRFDRLEMLILGVLNYLDGIEPSNWISRHIDIKNFKNNKPAEHNGIGIIFFRKQGELNFICAGGYSADGRTYLGKIEQEVSTTRPGDNARIFFTRLKEAKINDPNSYIRSCECIALTPNEEISSAEMDIIVHAIYALKTSKYRLKGNRTAIIGEWKEMN